MQYPQWQGDDITANPGSNKQACAQLDAFRASADNKGVVAAWNQHYKIIQLANDLIDNAGRTQTSATERNIALGQAHFWRAYAYFYLVRIFGPLPVSLHSESDGGKTQLTDVEGVYKLIVDDLTKADELNLPTSYKGEPRNMFGCDVYVTQQAVKSTLAAVYMAMAGYPLNKGQEYYAKAAEAAEAVIKGVENGTYNHNMDPEWKNVYSMGNNYNKETILGINNSPNRSWSRDSELTSTMLFESLKGWGDAWGEIAFWKRMPDGPRKQATYDPQILKEEHLYDWWATTDGQPIQADKKNAVIPEYHPMFSLFTVNADDKNQPIAAPYDYTKKKWRGMINDHRHRVIRYPEVLLWYAESAARAGKSDLTLAKECLKKVRARAVEPSEVNVVDGVQIDAMNAEQLAKACWDEHGWEVAGHWLSLVTRRADQLRMDDLKNTFARRVANAPIEVAPGFTATEAVAVSGTWTPDMNYVPYPLGDNEKNGNLKR
jgi:putative outer membrane protein